MANRYWNWSRSKQSIGTLPGRLGFPRGDSIEFLKMRLDVDTGELYDYLKNNKFSTNNDIRRSAYYILEGYANSPHIETSGSLINYKRLRGTKFGEFSNQSARQRFLYLLGTDTRTIQQSYEKLEGAKIDFPYGDIAFKINALPLIPITFVLTKGDEEFSDNLHIFYDQHIESLLDVERINFLTHLTVRRLADAKDENLDS